MGLFGFGSNKNKKPADPPGKGVGPSFVGGTHEAAMDPHTPYVRAAPTYAQPATNTEHEQELTKGHSFTVPPDIPPQDYTRYRDNYRMRVMNPQEHLSSGAGYAAQMGYNGAPQKNHHGFEGGLSGVWQPSNRELPTRSPSNYRFTRPWDLAPRLRGNHFSMADHPTGFPSVPFGMTPVGLRRNTYRVDPTPGDINNYDTTPGTAALASTVPDARNVQADPLPHRTRSYRL